MYSYKTDKDGLFFVYLGIRVFVDLKGRNLGLSQQQIRQNSANKVILDIYQKYQAVPPQSEDNRLSPYFRDFVGIIRRSRTFEGMVKKGYK